MNRFILALCILFASTSAANALAVVGLLAGPGTLTIAGLAVSSLGFRLLASVALSALSNALRPKTKQPGITIEHTTSGGTNPQSFIVGKSASAGNELAPPYSHGDVGGTPLAYLTMLVDFGDVAGISLRRVMINKEYVTLGDTEHPDFGFPIEEFQNGSGTDYAWVKFFDGSQTVADPFMLATFGSHPEFPWTADMVGTGIPQARFTFRRNRDLFPAKPEIRCEFDGIPLYDPRKDTTVGGTGAHRWADLATYETTTNPQLIKYNIMRGVTLPDGNIWGGEIEAEDLPLDNWFAAMNVCDLIADGETDAQYQAGYEITLNQQPAEVIEELDKVCSGQTVEIGGVFKTRTGGPGLPVYFMTDDDIIVTKEQELDPFPGIEASFNGVQATYPDPDSLWAAKEAPARYNPTYEAEDQGQRRVADLQFPAAPFPKQIQRLMVAYIEEERRFRRHSHFLPPDAAILEPLDAIAWTSARNGYDTKLFEVSRNADDQVNCNQAIAIRERDNADYSWIRTSILPQSVNAPARVYPVAQTVPDFAVAKHVIQDSGSADRKPALLLTWTKDSLEDVDAIQWWIRVKATAQIIPSGSTNDIAAEGVVVSEAILSATEYEVQARLIVDRPTVLTSWLPVTTDDIRLGYDDLTTQLVTDIASAAKIPAVAVLPADNVPYGDVVFLLGDELLYRWTIATGVWTAAVNATQIVGTLIAGQVGAAIIGTEHLAANSVTAEKMSVTSLSAISAVLGTFKTAETGERVEISDGLIEGYYANGNLAFRQGIIP